MVALVAHCGSCGKQFQAKPELAGKTVACPTCSGRLTVPARASSGGSAGAVASAPQIVACQCGARFKAGPQLAGRTAPCPSCKRPLQVPAAAQRVPAAASRKVLAGAARGVPATAPRKVPAGASRGAPAQAPPQPADDFWDELLPREKPKPAPTPTPPPKTMAGHEATAHAIKQLSSGHSAADVRRSLVENGCPAGEADRVIGSLVPEAKVSRGSGEKSSGLTNMFIGGLLCFVGLAVTVGSYVAAEPGGYFYLAYGPVIFGGIQFFRGMGQLAT